MQIDDKEQIFKDEILLGNFDGFIFQASETYEQDEEAENFILENLTKKIDRLINEGDAAIRFSKEFDVTYNDAIIAKLIATDNILKPDFTPVLDDRIQGIALARLALHLESWLKRQLNAIADPLDILNKTEGLSTEGQEFVQLMTEYLGYVPRYKIDSLVKKISPDDRVKLRKAGVRFAQYGVFIRDLLKPGAQKIKLILWSLKNNIPLPEMPPSGVVSIPYNPDLPEGYYDIAGYKVCGDYAVRSDMIEKLADAIRPLALKSDENPKGEFEITANHMSLVGKSGEAFDAILKNLGYDFRTEMVTVTSVSLNPKTQEKKEEETSSSETETPEEPQTEEVTEEKAEETPVISEEIAEPAENEIEEKEVTSQDETPSEASDNAVTINEKEVEKKIWFWDPPVKSKPFIKKPKKPFNQNKSDSQSDETENSFKGKKKPHHKGKQPKSKPFDKNRDKHKEQKNAPYVNMPKKHKIANENNPFAALMELKKEK